MFLNALIEILFVLVPLEIQVLKREHFNRWFRLGPYMISILLIEIPFQVNFNDFIVVAS